jgi:hypothetical protein
MSDNRICRPLGTSRQLRTIGDACRLFREHRLEWKRWQALFARAELASGPTRVKSISLRGNNKNTEGVGFVDKDINKSHSKSYDQAVLIKRKLDALNSMEAQLRVVFQGENISALLSNVQKLKDQIESTYQKVEDKLADKTVELISPVFTSTFKSLNNFIKTRLDGDYTQKSTRVLSAKVGEDTHVSGYILLTDLKTSDGFKHDEFYFILTEVVTPAKVTRWYISLTPVFSLPGHYNFDAEGQNIGNITNNCRCFGIPSRIKQRKHLVDCVNVICRHWSNSIV